MTKHLKKAYPSFSDAEDAYGVDYFEMPVTSTPQTPKSSQWQDQPLSPIFGHSPSVKSHLKENVFIGDIVVKLVLMFKTAMTKRMQLQLITYLLKVFIESTYGLNFLHFIHGDIIETVISGVNTLYCNGKKNLLYIFSKILSQNKLALDRMPFGLIDYNLRFFHAESAVKLEMEDHYAVWQETMMAHFGHKWIALHRGPMWQYDEDDCTPALKENVANVSATPVSNDIISEALAVSGVEDVLCDVSAAVMLGDAGVTVCAPGVVLCANEVDGSTSDDLLGGDRVHVSTMLGASEVDGSTSDVLLGADRVHVSTADDLLGANEVDGSASDYLLGGDRVHVSTADAVLRASEVDGSTSDYLLGADRVHVSTADAVLGANEVDGSTSDYLLGGDRVHVSTADAVLGANEVDGSASDYLLGADRVHVSTADDLLGANEVDGSTSDYLLGNDRVHVNTADAVSSASHMSHLEISTLWLNLSSSEVDELFQHGVDPSEMDKRHGLTQQKGRQSKNSGLYKPRKVTK